MSHHRGLYRDTPKSDRRQREKRKIWTGAFIVVFTGRNG